MRDHILNVLTKVNTQPIDISVNEIITKLISRFEGLLDDNKKLALANNEIIPLGRNTRVVFVVRNASTALMSPANVSRLGWVNFDTSPASKSWFW